ncbi:autotransporter-associated beta strand repeat-containing protein [Paenibacillus algorifonticola]|uniref:Autotransporter-associated beta strand repeat-containing protein n=1 Tax=Paenibacillus algorifonticola TaxID=684063 RepID=A0A1I2CR97_9BACL|nr:S-layer homology domain-containing protein [Paenibacillus algorifonticola]SFE70877.1 autotransporter-associated beta strand repeat-containing protein [Paenibacillus algorifonticola]
MKKKSTKKVVSVALGLLLLSNSVALNAATAASNGASIELPPAPAWGHFVDNYKNSISANQSVYSNPVIGVLSGFQDLWEPGTSWNNGTKLNSSVLDYNIQYVANIAATRTAEDEEMAYFVDRTNQSYGATEGLGALADVYRDKTGTFTTITSIPDDATSVKYNDGNGSNKAGDSGSELGKMVDLIGTLRGNYASSNPSKNFYSYMRPYRWANDTSMIVPTLVPAISATPATDGGFPSGHTNASYLASYALAYAVPERFQELLTRASEMGNSRIIAGMHSPLDVIGGRVMATALAAATLSDPDNAALKQDAYNQAHALLLTETGTAEDRFTDYEKNKALFTERLTYGFDQIHSTTEPMVVPKGAEVLLETRLPYLTGEQRRAVLATTGISSGYPVLDDPEGWGRLNLFAAADGYGAFDSDVTVTMDASKGGFYAADSWKNNIAGAGKLTKEGTGALKLLGANTFSGGTQINAGTLESGSGTALGNGDVVNNGGTLTEKVAGKMTIDGSFTQAANGTLELNVASASDVLEIKGAVHANGKLHVNFPSSYVPSSGSVTLISYGANQQNGQFTSVEISGVPSQYNAQVVYQADKITLEITNKSSSGGSSGSGNSSTPTPTPAPTSTPTNPVNQNSGVTVTAKADANGNAEAVIDDAQIKTVVEQAQAKEAGSKIVTLTVESADNVKSYGITLSKAAVTSLSAGKVDKVVVATPFGTITINPATLAAIEKAAGNNIHVKVAQSGADTLTPEAKKLVGARPVLDISVESGASNLSTFGGGSIQIDIPYVPAQGEDTSAIVAYYIDNDGKPSIMSNSSYSNGKVTFVTNHLSHYAVGYNKISFSDSNSHWGAPFISYLAARDMISGSGSNQFAPNKNITRAEFAKILAGIANADVSGYNTSTFGDVKAGDWYLPYVSWAAEHAIVQGSSSNAFKPNEPISREEMSVMLKRFTDQAGFTLPKSVSAVTFADQSSISSWATDAIVSLQQAEIISGKGANAFVPKGGATRAEAAKMLAVLHQTMN